MSDPAKNIALLIDADNASPDRFEDVLAILAELGTVNIRRAYGNWEKASLKGWKALTHRYAIEPQQQFDVTKGKSATDMRLLIDAMDLLYRGRVDGFGLMSSDSDFMPLAMRLRQDGLPVYGFGGAKTPESFRQARRKRLGAACGGRPTRQRNNINRRAQLWLLPFVAADCCHTAIRDRKARRRHVGQARTLITRAPANPVRRRGPPRPAG